jgi:TPR repeat protein
MDYLARYPSILTAVSADFRDAVAYFMDHPNDSAPAVRADGDHSLMKPKSVATPSRASANAQAVLAWIAEKGIGTVADEERAAQLYERSSERSGIGAACHGWCLRSGKGVAVNSTFAAESFQQAADFGDPDGANSLGVCLELGEGIEADIGRGVWYYQKAAAQSHVDGMYNFGRCLEYGKGIARDPLRAAKFYRAAADRNHAAAQNCFGICLERGIGVQPNQTLAAEHYQRSANNGHSDGANNLGFCLEYGRGVVQNIKLAAEYYKFAADRGHAEALVNYRRCLRLFGEWQIPDRSMDASSHPPSRDDLAEVFIHALDDPAQFDPACSPLIASIERLKSSRLPQTPTLPPAVPRANGTELWRDESAVVRLGPTATTAVKTATHEDAVREIEREAAIHRVLKHPLVIAFREFNRESESIVTELAANGALSDHLPSANGDSVLRGANRIARIAVGIVFGMRYLHDRGVVHRDLRPEKVLLDWDWNVRIAGFGRSISPEVPDIPDSEFPTFMSRDWRYSAPECFANQPCLKSDVFSFAMILYELIVGEAGLPGLQGERAGLWIVKLVAVEGYRPPIPDWVAPKVAELIRECWAQEADDRPAFWEILERLEAMDFKLLPGVNSVKIGGFAAEMKRRETAIGADP